MNVATLKGPFRTGAYYFFLRNMNNPFISSIIKQQSIEVRNVLTKETADLPETDSESYQQLKNLGYLGQQGY